MAAHVTLAATGLTLLALVAVPGTAPAADSKHRPQAVAAAQTDASPKPTAAAASDANAKPGGTASGTGKKLKTSKTARQKTPDEQAAIRSGLLSEEEVGLNCKKMAGRVKIRILELRGGGPQRQGSAAAQGIQSTLTPIFGGTKHGSDVAGQAARDIAKMKAMNEIMKARKCPYFDVDAELAQPVTARSPQLIRSGVDGKPLKNKGLGRFLGTGKP